MDLHERLHDLHVKLLDIANIPPAERTKLVREVLLSRELEVSKAKREVRSLREQLKRLELYNDGSEDHLNNEINNNNAILKDKKHINPMKIKLNRQKLIHTYKDLDEDNHNINYDREVLHHDKEEDDDEHYDEQDRQYHQNHIKKKELLLNANHHHDNDNPMPSHAVLTKRAAQQVVVQELRRLQKTNAILKEENAILHVKVSII